MSTKPIRKPLGRGLSALISTPPVSVNEGASAPERISRTSPRGGSQKNQVVFLDVNKVAPNEAQPRKEFKDQELEELCESIKALGVIQPIVVRVNPEDKTKYQIVAGERRWRASKLAKLTQVPVIIRDLEDKETLEIALVENIQRQNLNSVEEARAYQALMDEFSLSQKELSERVGKNRSSIANYVRILKLPNDILDYISENKISLGHAKAILSVKEPAAQINLANKVIAENLSVHALEDIVGRVVVLSKGKSKKTKNSKSKFPQIEERLKNSLGTKVRIKHQKNGSGVLEVSYFSEEELSRLVDQID